MQSTLTTPETPSARPAPLHLAIIMDGNGRWARRRGLPRSAGHRAGALAVRRIVEAAAREGIGLLTLYAFSSDNWHRPPDEVRHLMRLFRRHLRTEVDRLVREGIRLTVIGRRDRLPEDVVSEIVAAESRTRDGSRLHLQLAVDYSARDTILRAFRLTDRATAGGREQFGRALGRAMEADSTVPDVDLLIRTGGERRLSDFLLWECAYAELYFTSCPWPDFDAAGLVAALDEYHRRERRFGALPSNVGPESSADVPPIRLGATTHG